ncbi:MAG: phage tail tape measure protein [bacterium]|nr:phage tail tape measure protein [bacterium]
MSAQDLKLRVLLNLIDGATQPLKNILNGNRDLAKSLKDSRDQLKELGRAQKDVAAFRTLHNSTKEGAAQMAAAQAKINELAAAMRASGAPTKAMTRDFERAKLAAGKLKDSNEQQQAQLQVLRSRLSGAGIDTHALSGHERDLRSNIMATTAAMQRQQAQLNELAARERKLAQARASMQATQATAGKLAGSGAGAVAAGAAIGAPVIAAVSSYAKAEDSATQLQVALMRAGSVVPPEFAKINALAMKLGDKLPGATSDFQDMMTMLNRKGISSQAILGGMGEATAYLGVQLKKVPAEAAEFAATLQDATRTSESDMMGLMDVIQKTFYLGVDDNNMLQGFAKLSPAMDILRVKGLAAAKALAPLLVMANQAGQQGETAGNAYRKIFQMSMDKKKVAKGNSHLEKGQQLDFTDGKGEFAGLDNMFKQLDKLKGLNTQKRNGVIKEIFGDDGDTMTTLTTLREKGAAGYAEVQARMAAQASLQERVTKQLGTLKNLWDATSGTFTNGMVALGESIAPELKAVTEWLGNAAQSMGAWARENPRLAGGLMKTVAVLAILLTVGGGLLLMLASILGPMAVLKFSMATLGMQGSLFASILSVVGGALRLVGTGVLFIGRALLMNPIGLIITGIAIAAFLIYKYWEPIKAFFLGLWDQIRTAFNGGLTGIAALVLNWSPLGLFYKGMAAVLSWFGIELPAKFSEFGGNLLSGLVSGITNGLGAVKTAIVNVADSTVGWFKEKLGIHSPSRVFNVLGGFISQGAAGGIEGEQGRVAKAAAALAMLAGTSFSGASMAATLPSFIPPAFTKLAQISANIIPMEVSTPIVRTQIPIDMRPSVTARPTSTNSPSSPSGGNDQYTINIFSQPGMDEASLIRMLRTELERIERAKKSRINSRLSD